MKNNIDNILYELQQHNFWCVWRLEQNGKVPFNPKTGGRARSNNPSTFSSFQTAYQALQKGSYDGLGVGIFKGIGAIDIDNCIVEGVLSNMAQEIIAKMGSYTEYSPSGKGIRIIFRIDDDFEYDKELFYINNPKHRLEIYISGSTHKFVTITGNRINENPVTNATPHLKEVLKMYMQKKANQEQLPETKVKESPVTNSDFLKIGLEKDEKLKSYWYGDRTKASESECDAGLMSKLMYWLNNNTQEAIGAFRSSPYARQKDEQHKKKLERPDYLPNLAKAMMATRTAAEDSKKWLREQPKSQKAIEDKLRKLNAISAQDLQKINFPPREFLVDNFLSTGVSILGGPPKAGKSFFGMLLSIRIATGEPFLQWQTKQAGVLYLSFEDTKERLQRRMNKLLNGAPAPPWLHFGTDTITLEDDLLEVLNEHIKEHPQTKLVIIDTLQKIRGQSMSGERWYGHDYREVGVIKEFADRKGIAVLFITHTNKSKDKDNPTNDLTGTTGLTGVMDTIFVLQKSRDTQEVVLYTTGRDIEGGEFTIQFNKDTCQWEFLGDADELAKQEAEQEYLSSPIRKTIIILLDRSFQKTWKGNATSLMKAGEMHFGISIVRTPQALTKELARFKDHLLEHDGILYTITPNGNAGNWHHFEYVPQNKMELSPYVPPHSKTDEQVEF